MSLDLNMQMSNDIDYQSFDLYNFQRTINHNIIYIRQIKADDK
jgi:hypothetical protein